MRRKFADRRSQIVIPIVTATERDIPGDEQTGSASVERRWATWRPAVRCDVHVTTSSNDDHNIEATSQAWLGGSTAIASTHYG